MKVLLYGNCQLGSIEYMLKQAKPDLDIILHYSYLITQVPEQLIIDLQVCDVFIYHPVFNHQTVALTTPELVKHLRPGCHQVRVQNLHFSPYFPELTTLGGHTITRLMVKKLKQLSGICTENYQLSPLNGEELIKKWKSTEQQRFAAREFDVTMTDWILENYQDRQLFYKVQHCCTSLYTELIRRIFAHLNSQCHFEARLGTSFADLQPKFETLHEFQGNDKLPIMEEVKEALQLRFDCDCGTLIEESGRVCSRDEYMAILLKKMPISLLQ